MLRNFERARSSRYSRKNNKVLRIDLPEILKARQALYIVFSDATSKNVNKTKMTTLRDMLVDRSEVP